MKGLVARMVAIAFLVVLAVKPVGPLAAEVLGARPRHLSGGPSTPANQQALTRMIWAPGIDEGYVPQGLTIAEGSIRTGEQTGSFDLPEECGHGGGLVHLGKGVLIVSDTRRLLELDLGQALRDGDTSKALLSTVKLAGDLKGSFIDFDGTSLFIGTSEKDAGKAKGYFLPMSILDDHKGKSIREDVATRSFPIAVDAQGAAFDRKGRLWMTSSNSKHGELMRVDAASGEVLARYDMVIGIEDLGFDDEGMLWSVSEAGSLRWSKWSSKFPLVFRIDATLLR